MKNSLSSINDIASRKYHIKGFTLIELLIYTGISVIIGGLTVGILLTVTRVNQNASATAEVSGQMNFVLQRLQQLVSESSNIEIEVATTTSALKLRMQDSAKDPTCISLVNGVIKIAEGPGSPNANDCNSTTSDLTSPKVVVNTLNFKKMVQYPGHDTLSLDMTMAYNTTNPGSQVSRSLSSAIGRVSAATFDSDVIPGGTYEFSLGQTGAPWFKTITADGTAANPSYTFANNTGTGLFRAGANILGFTTAGLERMRIDASGNVGIGTTGPTYQLQLSTDSAAKPTSNTWTIASDGRIKDVVGPYNRGLKEVLQINPILYTYKENNALGIVDPGEHIGIVAQDVQSVIPEAVSIDTNGYLHFTADPLNWAMVNAIKELKAENEGLKKRIEALETR